MMNAETMAENRPVYLTHQPRRFRCETRTHKGESCIQIVVVFLTKVLVVFSDFLPELVVKMGPGVVVALLQDRLQGVTQRIF